MARKFVRNITGSKLIGSKKEPLHTNVQNDILSDEHDVYIRNKNDYHCLTNDIKKIVSANDNLIVRKKDKNTAELEVVGGGSGGYKNKIILDYDKLTFSYTLNPSVLLMQFLISGISRFKFVKNMNEIEFVEIEINPSKAYNKMNENIIIVTQEFNSEENFVNIFNNLIYYMINNIIEYPVQITPLATDPLTYLCFEIEEIGTRPNVTEPGQ